MILYTCGQKTSMGRLPGPLAHACGRAGVALEDAGHPFEIRTVEGYRAMPWTTKGEGRDELVRLTGQKNAPVLVFDDGTAISGSTTIARWAKEHPAA
ncbi:MAG: glutathione S-transferase N-terminal domain-containing protein [Solirubrobacteraceae bacterium]